MTFEAVMKPGAARQGAIGLGAFAAIFLGWAALHIYGVFFFEITAWSWPFALLMAAVQCWLSVGLFIVAHDAMHGTLAPGRARLNAAIGAFVLFLYAGFRWRRMKDAHMDHHAAPGSAADPDFNAADPKRFWPWYALFLKRYFGPVSAIYVVSVVTVYALLFRADVANIVLLYGAPAIASSLQLFYFGTYLPHRHDGAGFADHHNARSNDYPAVLSLLTCFHFGYHHEHHLHPGTPWWALPDRRRAAKAS